MGEVRVLKVTKKYMKNYYKSVLGFALMMVLMFGFVPLKVAQAAATPSLGLAGTYGVLSGTFTHNIANTVITGDVGYTTSSGGSTFSVISGTDYGPGVPTPQARIDAGIALTTLNSNLCTENLGIIVDLATVSSHPTGVYTPGVYCSTGAMSIGTGGITLSGAGTFIFRPDGALTSVNNSIVTLTNGASSCDVFWTPTSATTLGANTTFIGTIIDNANAITVGHLTSWIGRALSLGAGTVTTDTNTINATCTVASVTPPLVVGTNYNTITVFKQIINDNGGTAVTTDFPLFINGNPVTSGQSVSLVPGIYTITETNRPGYTRTFTGNCDASGRIVHGGINTHNDICTVINNDIGVSVSPTVPPFIDLIKTASPLSLPAGAGSVVYTYTLSNIGTVPVTNVTIIGDTCSPLNRISGDINGNASLDLDEVWLYTCTKIVSETHTNTAVATGWANGISAVDVASATVLVGTSTLPPLIHVLKMPNYSTLFTGAGTVIYYYSVTNPGIVPLSDVYVTDDKCLSLPGRVVGHPGDLNQNNLLENNEVWNFTCPMYLSQTVTNTAIAYGSANGLIATDFALATVIVANTPTLPTTGFGPADNNILDIIIPTSLLAVLTFLYFTLRKTNSLI